MKLHQLKIDFNAEQDRLLMLVSTDDGAVVRMWLTRRFVKLLWPLLVKLAEEANPQVGTIPADARPRHGFDIPTKFPSFSRASAQRNDPRSGLS